MARRHAKLAEPSSTPFPMYIAVMTLILALSATLPLQLALGMRRCFEASSTNWKKTTRMTIVFALSRKNIDLASDCF
jgi:hypothetical protein